MPTVDFLPYATATGANVLTQPEYVLLTDRDSGMGAGLVPSPKMNKVLRQASFMVAALAEFVADRTGNDVLDNGNVTALRDLIFDAVNAVAAGAGTGGVTIDNVQTQVTALSAGYVEPINASGSTRTFLAADAGACVRRSNSSAMTDTIPAGVFDVGTTIIIRNVGPSTYALSAASGVTLNVPTGTTATARDVGSSLYIHQVALNEWDLTGDLGAV